MFWVDVAVDDFPLWACSRAFSIWKTKKTVSFQESTFFWEYTLSGDALDQLHYDIGHAVINPTSKTETILGGTAGPRPGLGLESL
jgi:hypothetical protein